MVIEYMYISWWLVLVAERLVTKEDLQVSAITGRHFSELPSAGDI